MDERIIKFDDTEIEKYKCHQYDRPILIDNIDVNKLVVYNKISFGKNEFKYFIGYKDAKKQTFMHITSKNECKQKTY